MISKEYKKNKEQVLELYDEYVNTCKVAEKKVDESICEQAKKIKNEIFNLMILGEAKSGKSTFINAYLGKEVVPMDVRQCTSAIIKIRKGDKFELTAKTAGGGKTTVVGYDKIKAFLKEHAAISDEYRNIPITTINNELLIKYHGKNIPNRIMTSFLEEEAKDNIFNMNIDEYNDLIRAYVKKNADSWGKIITEMEITYQLPDEMQGITIIDSPGIGAGGNVGKIAEDYISNANAIIFIKSLNGQALESSSFMNFLKNNCTARNKESLFLVLTGKANLQGSEFASLEKQAIEMYKNDIDEEKIICVDSKMQLFLNKCLNLGTEEKINEFFDALDDAGDDFAPASKSWLKTKDIAKFEDDMEEKSNFRSVRNALEKFARVANYIQLIEFLENLENEYTRYKGIFSDTLNIAKKNIDDPIALEDRIIQKKNEIAEVYSKMNEGIMDIYKRYTDNINSEGIIMSEAEAKQDDYERLLENFRNLPESQINENTFANMKRVTLNAIDDTKDFRREMADRIIAECNEKLIRYTTDSSKIPAEAYIPNFTETDFDNINYVAKEKTSGYDLVEKGFSWSKTEERVPYHHLKGHVKLVADSIHDRLHNSIIPTMINNVVDYVTECCNVYKEKLTEHKKELDDEYQKLIEDKNSNENRRKNVEDLEKKVEIVCERLTQIAELKGELKNYVEKQ